MNQKAYRYLTLSPILLSLLTLLRPYVSSHSFVAQFFLPSTTIFGVCFLCVIWFIYFSNYRYGRQILAIQGAFSFLLTGWIVIAHYAHIDNSLVHIFVPANTGFLLNLSYMFMAGYLIQVLYYWLPRTKVYIDLCLAVILFMSFLSIFGHIYTFHGVTQDALLLPTPFGALISYFILTLVIFTHANHMEQVYLNNKIILSFATMFVAVIGANVVVYKNLEKTVQISNQIDNTRQVLMETYDVDFYLDSAQSSAQAYETSGDIRYITLYRTNRQAYLKAVVNLQKESSASSVAASTYKPIHQVTKVGDEILGLADSAVAQKPRSALDNHLVRDAQIDSDMDEILDEIKTISLAYTNQLNQLTQRETLGSRGIVLGVSISSALSLLLIIFTPLFIRQSIQRLAFTQDKLQDSNKLLSEEKSRAEAILAGIGDGLFVIDTDGVITVFNQAAESIARVKRDSVLGKPYREVLRFTSFGDPDTLLDFTTRALEGTIRHLSHNVVLQLTNGQTVDVEVTASPVKNRNGGVIGAIVVFRDRSSEQALENAKDEFVSLASHQLRTPATATKQFLAMFLQGYAGPIDDKQRLFLQQAYDNNELGINIIEDLLNITRLESNRLKVVKEKIELGAFLRKSVEQHQTFAERGKQTLRLVTPTKQVYIEADPSLLGMGVDNLITNALKYSNEGDTITVELTSGTRVSIAVSDHGIGIKKEDIPKLFERFRRLEDPQKQYVSGTGIGLYLVKKIIRKLHATIKVESKYGKGSTFTLEFKPLK